MKTNNRNIAYVAIGVATLILSIVGATFAYFTATASVNNVIKGNMATIDFDVSVTKMTNVDVTKKGLIPMSNNMMEQALTKNAAVQDKGVCVDDNGNAVCQVYKITVENNSTASMFVDGYVTLENGSGNPTDYSATTSNKTTMRWAQAFCTAETSGVVTTCTTDGLPTVRATNASSYADTWFALGGASTKENGKNQAEIKTARTDVTYAITDTNAAVIKGNKYEVIKQNYIRVSDHAADDTTFTRQDDTTSALVYNQYLEANDGNDGNNTGMSNSTYTDSQVYYIVVWLTETGSNQTAGVDGAAASAEGFFTGKATFISAQGSEVTATFNGLTKVTPTDTPGVQQ